MSTINVYKMQDGKQAEITNAKAVALIAGLFATNPASQKAYEVAQDEKLVTTLASGKGQYKVVVTDEKDNDKSFAVIVDKANVNQYVQTVLSIGKAINSALSFVKVEGERGKRGRTSEELDYSEL